MLNTLGKIITALFWLLFLYNLFQPLPGAASTWVTVIGLVLLVAHVVECVLLRRYIERDHADNPKYGYVMVMLFGVLHSGEWLKEKRGGNSP